MHIDRPYIRRLHHLEVDPRLFRRPLGDEGLPASRRTVEEHPVRRRYPESFRQFPVLQYAYKIPRQQPLQVIHPCHCLESAGSPPICLLLFIRYRVTLIRQVQLLRLIRIISLSLYIRDTAAVILPHFIHRPIPSRRADRQSLQYNIPYTFRHTVKIGGLPPDKFHR